MTTTTGKPLPAAVLRTQRLVLRAFEDSDEDAVLEACSDELVQQWTTVPKPYTRAHARRFVHEVAPESWANGSAAIFAVTLEGRTVACVGLHLDRRADPGIGEIGFWSTPAHRGQGIVTEALDAVCRWGFSVCGLTRIEWYAEVGNEASRRVAEKAGFTAEGLLRGFLPAKGGRADAWSASLLASDITG